MNNIAVLLVSVSLNMCMETELSGASSIASSVPSLDSVYDCTADLDYSQKALNEIATDFHDKYGLLLSVPIETMDLYMEVEGDEKKVFELLCDLFVQHPFRFVQQGQAGDLWVGLEGEQEVLTKIVSVIEDRFQIPKLQKGNGVRINLKGVQVPCWQAIGQIAQKANLSIERAVNSIIFENNGREVIGYEKIGPYYVFIIKENKTAKLAMHFMYNSDTTTDVWDVHVGDVFVVTSDGKNRVDGSTLTMTAEDQKCAGLIKWISNEPIRWDRQMSIEGNIKGPILTRAYEIQNLGEQDCLKQEDIEVSCNNTRGVISHLPADTSNKSGILEGRPVNVKIKLSGNLTEEEKTFLQIIEQRRQKKESISGQDENRYEDLLKKVQVIEVFSIGKPTGASEHGQMKFGDIFCYRAFSGIEETTVVFDSVQNGKDIFPIGMELRRYQPQTISFSVKVSCASVK